MRLSRYFRVDSPVSCSDSCRDPRCRIARRSAAWCLVFLATVLIGSEAAFAQLDSPQPLALLDLTGVDPVASNPYGLARHPNLPRVYVALSGEPTFGDPTLANGSTVVEYDLDSGAILRSFSVGFFPTDLVIPNDGSELFVVSSTGSVLTRIDLVGGGSTSVDLVDSMGQTVGFPTGIECSADQSQLFISSNGGGFDGSQENMLVLDRATLTLSDTVEIVGGLGRFAVLSDGRVVVPVGFPEDVFPSNPELRVYDSLAGWEELTSLTLAVDISDFPAPFDVVVSDDETRAYVSVLGGSSQIFVVDLTSLALDTPLTLPFVDFAQSGLALGDGTLWVGDFEQAQVRGFEVDTGELLWTLPTGAGPNSLRIHAGRLLVSNQNGISVSSIALPGSYRRGDTNGDGSIDISDGVQILSALFGGEILSCQRTADVNADLQLDLSDAVFLFQFLFNGGAQPLYPTGDPGVAIDPGLLSCGA